ncbi:hypothetical protein EDB19DRAFT_1637134, partial [Suillus lakei]
CTGLVLADASICTTMPLPTFDISKVVGNGVESTPEIEPRVRINTLSQPKLFKCSIKPRSARATEFVQRDIN